MYCCDFCLSFLGLCADNRRVARHTEDTSAGQPAATAHSRLYCQRSGWPSATLTGRLPPPRRRRNRPPAWKIVYFDFAMSFFLHQISIIERKLQKI